jgi:hypothetical protein
MKYNITLIIPLVRYRVQWNFSKEFESNQWYVRQFVISQIMIYLSSCIYYPNIIKG